MSTYCFLVLRALNLFVIVSSRFESYRTAIHQEMDVRLHTQHLGGVYGGHVLPRAQITEISNEELEEEEATEEALTEGACYMNAAVAPQQAHASPVVCAVAVADD